MALLYYCYITSGAVLWVCETWPVSSRTAPTNDQSALQNLAVRFHLWNIRESDRIRERFIIVLQSLRSTPQNIAKRNWMKFFTLTSEFIPKVSGRGVIVYKFCDVSARSKDLAMITFQIAGKLRFATASRDQRNFLLRPINDAIVFSIFLRELLYQQLFSSFDWLLMTICCSKLVHSWRVVTQTLITWPVWLRA